VVSRDWDPNFQSLQAARQVDFKKSSLSTLLHLIGVLPRIAGSFVALRSDRACSCQIRSVPRDRDVVDLVPRVGIASPGPRDRAPYRRPPLPSSESRDPVTGCTSWSVSCFAPRLGTWAPAEWAGPTGRALQEPGCCLPSQTSVPTRSPRSLRVARTRLALPPVSLAGRPSWLGFARPERQLRSASGIVWTAVRARPQTLSVVWRPDPQFWFFLSVQSAGFNCNFRQILLNTNSCQEKHR
jgi:hypothetical protein